VNINGNTTGNTNTNTNANANANANANTNSNDYKLSKKILYITVICCIVFVVGTGIILS
jgi:hypothetical protein